MKRAIGLLGAAVAALLVLLSPSTASAIELGTPAQEHPFRSAQNFALEIRASPYRPRVDKEPGLAGHPFEESFGDKPRLYLGLELDWQVFRIPHVGTIGPGVSAGIVSMSRPATTASGKASGDEYSLSIYPFTASAVLRADALWRDAGFPLVPYGKLGIGYALWRASNTGGTAEAAGVKGKGATWGTNVALGLAFALDVLDRGATVNMDNATGINNTYVFAELYWLTLDDFGKSNAFYAGSNSWTAGLAFEF
jgi:hypothetical protein